MIIITAIYRCETRVGALRLITFEVSITPADIEHPRVWEPLRFHVVEELSKSMEVSLYAWIVRDVAKIGGTIVMNHITLV